MLVVLFFISCYYLWRKWAQHKVTERKQAPALPGAWPVIGHLHLLRNVKLPHHALGAMADKYGPIFRLQLGSRSALVVSSWEMAKESMCVNDAAAASRPGVSGTKYFSYDFAAFGLAPYSPYWREIHKVTHMELLSNPRVDQVLKLPSQSYILSFWKKWRIQCWKNGDLTLLILLRYMSYLTLYQLVNVR